MPHFSMEDEAVMSSLFSESVGMAWLCMILVTAGAAIVDLRRFKVPNRVTIPLAVCGVMYHTILSGYEGLGFSVAGLAVGYLLLMLFFLIGAMGAGDVKLLAGVGAWLGASNTFLICLVACLAAGIYSLVVFALQGRLAQLASLVRMYYLQIRNFTRYIGAEESVDVVVQDENRRWKVIPFALMIAIGVLVVACRECGLLGTGSW
jgi:prepilin peptidase CpaA